jgi:antitoxin component of MazEF toxin-antitoxin module
VERRIMSPRQIIYGNIPPKNWMQLNELNKGDVVSFSIQRDRSLVVHPGVERRQAPKEITLQLGKTKRKD